MHLHGKSIEKSNFQETMYHIWHGNFIKQEHEKYMSVKAIGLPLIFEGHMKSYFQMISPLEPLGLLYYI